MPSTALVSPFVEFFTLKEAAALASRLDAAGRKLVVSRAELARQRAEAAESLWAAGHPAEALRLLRDAYEETREAAAAWLEASGFESAPDRPRSGPSTAQEGQASTSPQETRDHEPSTSPENALPDATPTSESVPVLVRFLKARGASAATLERLTALEKELSEVPLPLMDADVGARETELFDRLTELRSIVARALGDVTLAPRDVVLRRVARAGTVATALIVAIVGTYFALRVPEGIHARASAHYNEMPDFEPSRILDGNGDTSWLLPDRTTGWVEVTVNPPRTVSRVRLLNTHNTPYNDRATLQYRLRVFANGTETRAIDGSFEFSPAPSWVTHDIGNVEGVDRVRFEVRTWYQHGGGLAELALE